MDRLRIWDVDCSLLDVVLTLSFDAGELENWCDDSAPASAGHQHDGGLLASAVSRAHRACHQKGATARRLERALDLVHGPALAVPPDEADRALTQDLLEHPLGQVPDLPGRLWALLGRPGQNAVHLRAHLRHRLTLAGARSLQPADPSTPPTRGTAPADPARRPDAR